ncbi:hypothetical protein [Halovenus halobia]|uniref:hypothetical protein n=1 Tax=Halovenus halobia TaxID=3396622 RepID=UPI003F54D2AA
MSEDNKIRPNLQIPEKLHAEMKRLAEIKQVSIGEAYTQVVRKGIDYTVFPEHEPFEPGSFDCIFLRPRVRHQIGYEKPVIFHPKIGFSDEITAVRLSYPRPSFSFQEFVKSLQLASQQPGFEADEATFTIAREGGMWIGQGLDTFVPTFSNQVERYDQADFDQQRTEEFVLIVPVDAEYLMIKARPDHKHEEIAIKSMRSYRSTNSTGDESLRSVLGAFKAELETYEQTRDITTARLAGEVDPIDYFFEEGQGGEYVDKILIETPAELFRKSGVELPHSTYAPQSVIVDLNHQMVAEDRSEAKYRVSKISILDENNFTNVWIEGDWESK